MQGWRLRMEDAHIASINQGPNKNFHIFGVFDGHGGKEVSVFVSRHFVPEFLANENFQKGNIQTALKETFLKMDVILQDKNSLEELREIFLKSQEEDEIIRQGEPPDSSAVKAKQFYTEGQEPIEDLPKRAGCTSCVFCFDSENKKMYFANAGDSRVIVYKNGEAVPMSTDHKPELDIEKRRIYSADGWVSDGRVNGNLNLTRALGDVEYKLNKSLSPEEQIITANPDIRVEDFTNEYDFVVMGCDGVWDCLSNQEMCNFVKEKLQNDPNTKLSSIIEELLDKIIAPTLHGNETGIGSDNMTCIVITFKKN